MKIGPARFALWPLALVGYALTQTGCGDGRQGVPDGGGGVPDASLGTDAAVPDARGPDALPPLPDAAPPDAAPATADARPEDGCIVLEVGARDMHTGLFGQILGVQYPVVTPLDGPLPELLQVELFDSTTPTADGNLPPLAPGESRLGEGIDADLATCQHCVWIPLDWDHQGPLAKIFFATEGTFTLTEVTDPLDVAFVGAISEIVLREATVDETGASHLVEGGRCARVAAQTFDTRPTPGRACLSAEECGNSLVEVCSPATNSCTDFECNDLFLQCPAERPVCVSQNGRGQETATGACYADCNAATGAGCAFGQTCVQSDPDPTIGFCLYTGAGLLGSACDKKDNSTSCAPGLLCSAEAFCTRRCDFWAAAPGCQAGTECSLFGVCETPARSVDATFGEPCPDGATLGQGCAPDGTAFRGICFANDPTAPMVCQEVCLGELGCEAAEFCAPRFVGGLGICLPTPVCGDGQIGEVDELCDDGNTVSGDGCSADCRTVEYEPICAAAIRLVPGGSVSGDTRVGRDGFQAACQLGIARADVYSFRPPGRGQLRLVVDSPTQHATSLRAACADPQSELRCSDGDPFAPARDLVFNVTSDDASDLTVLVSAFTVLEQGPYTLNVEWTDEVCGDGLIAGREVCDDGNTVSGDGCRADCGEIEYSFYCAAATPLVAGNPVSGETGGDVNVFAGSCAAPSGSGPDQLFQYTAPGDGTLHLELADTGFCFVTMSATLGCDGPGVFPELGCMNTFTSSSLDVPVSRDQTVTVLVEGFGPENVCPFTLTAALVSP